MKSVLTIRYLPSCFAPPNLIWSKFAGSVLRVILFEIANSPLLSTKWTISLFGWGIDPFALLRNNFHFNLLPTLRTVILPSFIIVLVALPESESIWKELGSLAISYHTSPGLKSTEVYWHSNARAKNNKTMKLWSFWCYEEVQISTWVGYCR